MVLSTVRPSSVVRFCTMNASKNFNSLFLKNSLVQVLVGSPGILSYQSYFSPILQDHVTIADRPIKASLLDQIII